MRGFNRAVFLGRAIWSDSATISGIGSGTTCHRLPQLAFYATCSNPNPQWQSQKLVDHFKFVSPSTARSIAGVGGVARYSSAPAASIAHDTHAKGTPSAEGFMPKDVVLYQYEACPFCNKVKGWSSFSLLVNINFGS